MSRLFLLSKALFFRGLQTLGRWCDHYLSPPRPQSVSFRRRIPSTVGGVPGSFDLLFYTPKSYKRSFNLSSKPSPKHPILLNFHGGGFTIGHAADDARWATQVVRSTSAVVVSVNYRLAPVYPYPTAVEDGVSALLYLWKHAEELNLDIFRTAVSGFSSGGNLCFSVTYRLYEELRRLKNEDKLGDVEIGKIMSAVAFYPTVDLTRSRAERRASNPNHKGINLPGFNSMVDQGYLHPPPDMHSPYLSPALAPDHMVKDELPDKLVVMTCWADALLAEGERFRARLKEMGKRVDGYVIEGAIHGWDKFPTFWRGNKERDKAYKSAAESLREFWGEANDGNQSPR